MMTYKPSKLGQTNLVFGMCAGLSVGLCVQDCKSLHVAMAPWLTHRHTYSFDRLHY